MACYHPLRGFRAPGGRLALNPSQGFSDLPVEVACGQCVGCRIDRSKMWAARCLHEASLYDRNCFITLTYAPEHLPEGNTLVVSDFQKFMKRLRKKHGSGIRFFHCGEYGETYGRPHYHALLFNFDFEDKVLWKNNRDNPLYISADLTELWPFGWSTVGALTYQSAAYTARYIMKKITGPQADQHYQTVNKYTGEIIQKKPEYVTMSRRPGIGQQWYKQHHKELWPDDFIIIKGRKVRIPRYYDQQFEIEHPEEYAKTKRARVRNSLKHKHNNTPERLKVREQVQRARITNLKREID